MLIIFLCLVVWTWPPAVVGAPISTYGPSEVPSNFWTQKQRPQHCCHCGDHWATVVEHYASSAVTPEHYTSSAVTRELDYPSAAVTEQADPWSAVDNWTGRHQERPAAVDQRATDNTISATAYDQ
ncbi:hypothetical protein FWK35_00011616 [Aphis craccivora]|uniref:Secreted protein n=1 Tax=Aphis craccivora TaxID=307492 RepID=A0A6G0YZS4_APHCR|nr:hypothetical protein FWK35_00011616 [Aphis craccivora]